MILRASIKHGFGNPPIRMFAAPFAAGVSIWAFYAFQPYLLELFGDPNATYLAGIAAAVFAIAQMAGGASVKFVRGVVETRTAVIILEVVLGAIALVGVGLAEMLQIPVGFWVAIGLLTPLRGRVALQSHAAGVYECLHSL